MTLCQPHPPPAVQRSESVGCEHRYPQPCQTQPTVATVIPAVGYGPPRAAYRVCPPHAARIDAENRRIRSGHYADLPCGALPAGPYPELAEVAWDAA